MQRKTMALVAHDNKKSEMLNWVEANREQLTGWDLCATGTTGKLIGEETGLPIERLQSGPLGGDQQIGAKIAEGEVDVLLFFWDPLEPQPHDPDVKALLRIAVVWNIPVACNRVTADLMVQSLGQGEYERVVPDFGQHLQRDIPQRP